MAGLRLLIGLGNPGAEHVRTRHNAGFWFIDALAQRENVRFGSESKLHGESAKIVMDGRSILLVNQPLANGGWVATQEDITERAISALTPVAS